MSSGRSASAETAGSFVHKLSTPATFTICVALRPHCGAAPPDAGKMIELAASLLQGGRVDTFLLSHHPPESHDADSLALAREILRLGGTPLVSVSLANRTRRQTLETLAAFREAGVRHLVLVSGDYPKQGPRAGEQPFFDLDSLQLLLLIAAGEAGLSRGSFELGCVVSPFKTLESEQIWQYARLSRKVAAGADFVVAQAGFDPRRWDELARHSRLQGHARPLLGNLLVPDAASLRRITDGSIPGVTMAENLATAIANEQAQPDCGQAAGLQRAAGSLAVLRGLGYRGAVLGGPGLTAAAITQILRKADELADRWRESVEPAAVAAGGFHYFGPGRVNELNGDQPAAVAPRRRHRHPRYVLSHAIDFVAFGSLLPPFRFLAALCRLCDKGPVRRRALWIAEYFAKAPLYRCRMCGDCTLYACAFLCAEAGCPKRMNNGPCGGGRDGWCEVYPGKKRCFWDLVYGRLKGLAELPDFPCPPIPAKDRALQGTCSWINFCLGRDHRREWVRRRLGLAGR